MRLMHITQSVTPCWKAADQPGFRAPAYHQARTLPKPLCDLVATGIANAYSPVTAGKTGSLRLLPRFVASQAGRARYHRLESF